MKKAIVVLAIVFLFGVAVQAQMGGGMMDGGMMHEGQGGGAQTSQKATTGAEIFSAHCANCHPHGGNSIMPNLPVKGSQKVTSYKAFLTFIREPKMPDGSTGAMPPFSRSRISDQQAKKLYQYVSSL